MRKVTGVVTTFIMLLLATSVSAGLSKFEEAMELLCQKQRQCIQASLGAEETASLPLEKKKLIEDMAVNICDSYRQQFSRSPQNGFPLINEATACINSMRSQSCSEIENGHSTKACSHYEDLAEESLQ